MSDFVVEKNIALPEPISKGAYPLQDLVDVGDCLTIPLEDGQTIQKLTGKVRNAVFSFKQRHSDRKFATRVNKSAEGKDQVQVFRVA